MDRGFRAGDVLNWLSVVAMIAALYLVFLYAPTEATMGHLQRIFYFHVSSAWVGFFAFFVTLLACIAYLHSRKRDWDIVAFSSVEVGIMFTAMAVITGSIWARRFREGCSLRIRRSAGASGYPIRRRIMNRSSWFSGRK